MKQNNKNILYPVEIHYTEDGVEKVLHIRPRAPLGDLRVAVKRAVELLFSGGSCEFLLKHLAISSAVVEVFTDYSGSFEADEFLNLVDCTDFYSKIEKEIDSAQYFQLEDAIEEEITSRLSLRESDLFFSDLRELLRKWDKKLSRTIKPDELSTLLSRLSGMEITEEKLVDAIVNREHGKTSEQMV